MTLRAYIAAIHFEDNVFTHPAYITAANDAIRLYVQLYDEQAAGGSQKAEAAAARRKAVQTSKASLRAELVAAAAKHVEGLTEDDVPPTPDADPYGEQLIATTKPLEDAARFVRRLQEAAPGAIETWLSALEVALRDQKWLLALRAYSLGAALDADDPRLHVLLLRLRMAMDKATLSDKAQVALADVATTWPALTQDLATVHTAYVQKNETPSPAHVLGAAEGLWVLQGAAGAADAASLAHTVLRASPAATLADLQTALAFVRRIEGAEHVSLPAAVSSSAFVESAHAQWPLADAFTGADALAAHAAQRSATRASWQPEARRTAA